MDTVQDSLGKYRGTAVEIIETVEELLDKHGIQVPDDDRTGDESEGAIFGMAFAELEDRFADLLENVFPGN